MGIIEMDDGFQNV